MSLSRKGFLKMLGFGALAAGSKAYGWPSKALEDARAAAKKLKITDVEIFLFDIPLTSPFRIAIGEMTAANDLLVRVRTDQGVTGLGEACPFPPITGETQATNAAAAKAIRDMVIGKDPLAIDDLVRLIGPIVHSNPSAVAAFDMAFFDILGKVAGLPLFRLLGGTKNVFETDITTSLDTLEKMTAEAKGYADMGYKTLKVKVGLDPDEDFARLEAIRRAVGPKVAIRIDANQGWTVPQAIYGLRKMAPLAIQFCEQPVLASDTAGMSAVRGPEPDLDHGRRGPLRPGRRGQAHPGRGLRQLQHQGHEGRRPAQLHPHRPHRRRGQHALHGRLHAGDAAGPDGGRPRRGLAGQHRLRRPRRQLRARRGPDRRRHDGQGGDADAAREAGPRLRRRPGLRQEAAEGLTGPGC